MATRNIVLTIVGIFAVGLVGWYLLSLNSNPSTGNTALNSTSTNSNVPGIPNTGGSSTPSTSQNSQASSVSTGTLRSLVTRGGKFTCTITAVDNSNKTTGTIYGAGNESRLDLQIQTSDGTTVTTHTIRNGTYAYVWMEGQSVGQKSLLNSTNSVLPTPSGNYSHVSDTTQISSDCHPWIPDQSQFTPPKGITFVTP
jgi:hypothetical protein